MTKKPIMEANLSTLRARIREREAMLEEAKAAGDEKTAEAKPKRREWTQASAMHWMAEVAEGRERHGLQACSAFSFLAGTAGTGTVQIAYTLMAGIHGRIDRERREAEAKAKA
ncbi:MAG: hypothetical protein RR296_11775 [Clostridia bacterium]